MYSVKNVKSFEGREGLGYNCTLYCGKQRVATVIDSANGGEAQFRWLDHDAPAVEVTYDCYGRTVTRKATPNEAAFLNFIKGKTYEAYGSTYNYDGSAYVAKLVDDFEATKQFKRWCRKKTVFRVKGDAPDRWRTISVMYREDIKQELERRYGDQLEEVLNERFTA